MIDLEIQPAQKRENVRAYVYRTIYHNIMSFHLIPGTSMSEQEVADLLKTSRTPVREAFIHLSQDQLLDVLPQRGTFVSRMNVQMIREARFMRAVMEEAVVVQACQSFAVEALDQLYLSLRRQHRAAENGDKEGFLTADNEFHQAIFTGCGKPHIWETLMRASRDYSRLRMLNALNEPKMIPLGVHEDLARAIEAHDSERAVQLIRRHQDNFEAGMRKLLQLYPDYFI